jgi:hypothetical protein
MRWLILNGIVELMRWIWLRAKGRVGEADRSGWSWIERGMSDFLGLRENIWNPK